jgi:hypothetical protein
MMAVKETNSFIVEVGIQMATSILTPDGSMETILQNEVLCKPCELISSNSNLLQMFYLQSCSN